MKVETHNNIDEWSRVSRYDITKSSFVIFEVNFVKLLLELFLFIVLKLLLYVGNVQIIILLVFIFFFISLNIWIFSNLLL